MLRYINNLLTHVYGNQNEKYIMITSPRNGENICCNNGPTDVNRNDKQTSRWSVMIVQISFTLINVTDNSNHEGYIDDNHDGGEQMIRRTTKS